VFERDETGQAAIWHGYTYSAHPVGAAAALACVAELTRQELHANAAARGAELHAGLTALAEKHGIVGDVRGGHGLMAALEIVSDRAAKTPMELSTMKRIQRAAYEAGAMVRLVAHNIVMSPPLTLSSDDVGTILGSLDKGLASA
jgi:adenosylmethionine-8-amino-7-oxononanoate aminotransferase